MQSGSLSLLLLALVAWAACVDAQCTTKKVTSVQAVYSEANDGIEVSFAHNGNDVEDVCYRVQFRERTAPTWRVSHYCTVRTALNIKKSKIESFYPNGFRSGLPFEETNFQVRVRTRHRTCSDVSVSAVKLALPERSPLDVAPSAVANPDPLTKDKSWTQHLNGLRLSASYMGGRHHFASLDSMTAEGSRTFSYENTAAGGMSHETRFLHSNKLRALRADRTYLVNFDIRLGGNVPTNGARPRNATLLVYAYTGGSSDPTADNSSPDYPDSVIGINEEGWLRFFDNILYEERSYDFSLGGDVTDWQTASFTLKPTHWRKPNQASQINARVVINLDYTSAPSNTHTVYVRNFRIKKKERAIQEPLTPRVLSPTTSHATIPVMRNDNPVVRSDCPHLDAGLRDWDDPTIWPGNEVPAFGSDFSLPTHTRVLVTSATNLAPASNPYHRIEVPRSSELVFADDGNYILHVANMLVRGKMTMGSPTCPIRNQLAIHFYGSRTEDDVIGLGFGSKGLAVARSGTLDMHGVRYHPTWTRLARPAVAGDTQIYLQQKPDGWKAGMKIFLTTSWYQDHRYDQNEVKTIRSVHGRMVELTSRLEYNHWVTEDWQVEVGLLTRTIQVMGKGNTGDFGGHILINGVGRISGVNAYQMGQKNILARYPFHFHMMGAERGAQSYFRDNAVQKSFYRCYVIHGTNDTLVERNVAYNAMGHCYYIAEDGVEENNVVQYNLAAQIHVIGTPFTAFAQFGSDVPSTPDLRQPADITASGFYLTNKHNSLIGNAASGGWSGFSFPVLTEAIGNHRGRECFGVSRRPVKEIRGNTAHSAGYYWHEGGCMYSGGTLRETDDGTLIYNGGRLLGGSGETFRYPFDMYDSNCNGRIEPDRPQKALFMHFTDTKNFLCNKGILHWSGRIVMENYHAADVTRAGTLFGGVFKHVMVNADTGHPDKPSMFLHNIHAWHGENHMGSTDLRSEPTGTDLFQCYDQWDNLVMSDVVVKNMNRLPTSHPIIKKFGVDGFLPRVITGLGGFSNDGICVASNFAYENTDPDLIHYQPFGGNGELSEWVNAVDYDGSVTFPLGYHSSPTPSIIGGSSTYWAYRNDCEYQAVFEAWVCPKGDREVASIMFGRNAMEGTRPLHTVQVLGDPSRSVTRPIGFGAITGPTETAVYLNNDDGWSNDISFRNFKAPYPHYILLCFQYPPGTTFNIYLTRFGNNYDPISVGSVQAVVNGDGRHYHWNAARGHLYFKAFDLSATGARVWYQNDDAVLYAQHTIGHETVIQATNCNDHCAAVPDDNPAAVNLPWPAVMNGNLPLQVDQVEYDPNIFD